MISVYIERGSKRTFACAVDWPGWCRSGRDEAAALQALFEAAPRYGRALARKRVRFVRPKDASELTVVSRHAGTATTDFGAPDVSPKVDDRPVGATDLRQLTRILEACWLEFDSVAASARGKALRKGPRGGGRELEKIVGHVLEADAGYIAAMGGRYTDESAVSAHERADRIHEAFLDTVAASARGKIPARGPRGGVRWKPRYAVRRSAWHWLDHAWEIEDRATTSVARGRADP